MLGSTIAKTAGTIAGKYFDSKTKTEQLASEIESALIAAQSNVIIAEAKGGWLQRNWRPLLMLTAIIIIFNNYVIIPYARAFGLDLPLLELPAGLWALLTTGVGGYVVGRSAEKMIPQMTANSKKRFDRNGRIRS